MAEIAASSGVSGKSKAGVRRSKKLSTRVDLTPMVDLGFLLITFFIVTTTWSAPKALKLGMPADGPSQPLGSSAALTVLAGRDNQVLYYYGDLAEALKNGKYGITGYGFTDGIGQIIRLRQQDMDLHVKGGRKEMMLLIKPSEGSSYKNVVGLLDETLINGVSRYALMDLSEPERQLLVQKSLLAQK